MSAEATIWSRPQIDGDLSIRVHNSGILEEIPRFVGTSLAPDPGSGAARVEIDLGEGGFIKAPKYVTIEAGTRWRSPASKLDRRWFEAEGLPEGQTNSWWRPCSPCRGSGYAGHSCSSRPVHFEKNTHNLLRTCSRMESVRCGLALFLDIQ